METKKKNWCTWIGLLGPFVVWTFWVNKYPDYTTLYTIFIIVITIPVSAIFSLIAYLRKEPGWKWSLITGLPGCFMILVYIYAMI